jgi:acetyl-CoA carboxylase carboxyl transferase subunit beta
VAGTGLVGVALAPRPGNAPGVAGYRLLARAATVAGRLGLPLVTLVDTPGADPSPAAEAAGVAAAIGAAMAAVLRCPSPTVTVVVGEGGSGGALAATCADIVLMTPDSYLTALSPEGAAATLRITAEQAADLGGLRPVELVRLGFADRLLASGEPAAVAAAAVSAVSDLMGPDQAIRLATRRARWSTALPGHR